MKYELWRPPSEDEFEQIVKEHAQDIFGENACYFDIKRKLKTGAGVGSIPDGYVVVFDQIPCWYIVEVELSSHPLYEHIVPQITKFVNGIQNPLSQNQIVNTIDDEIANDPILAAWVKTRIQQVERHKFLSNLITINPELVVIIDKVTEELTEVCDIVSKSLQTKVVEFQTFTRQGVGLDVHAHLFEPLLGRTRRQVSEVKPVHSQPVDVPATEVTLQHLIDAGLVTPGKKLLKTYKSRLYEAEIMVGGQLRLLHDNTEWNSLSWAAAHITGGNVNGWRWWRTRGRRSRVFNGRAAKQITE